MYSKNNSRRFKMIRIKNKGFTLIELMVVIVIIGILAALAIPKFTDASAKAKAAEPPTILASYDHAQLAYLAETGALGALGAIAFDSIPTAGSKWFNYTAGTGTYTGKAKAAFGKVATTDTIGTTVSTTSVVTHAASGGFATYNPNWK